jgi:hypothetical protein
MKTYNIKLPVGLKNRIDLRDVIPIMMQCELGSEDVFEISEGGVDISKNIKYIVLLANEGKTVNQIIKILTYPNNVEFNTRLDWVLVSSGKFPSNGVWVNLFLDINKPTVGYINGGFWYYASGIKINSEVIAWVDMPSYHL